MKTISKLNEKGKNILYGGTLILIGIFYFFFLGDRGYILEPDSMTFITKELPEYWVYISFLDVCEAIFGSEVYLEMVNIIQGLFALVISLIVTSYLQKKFRLNRLETLLIYLATFLPYGYSLPQNVATHHILTEGLSYTFFHLFMLFIFITFLDKKVYMMLPAGFMLWLLMGTRSQLMLLSVVYVALWIVLGLQYVYHRVKNKKMFWIVVASVIILVVASVPFMMKILINYGPTDQFITAMSGRTLCTIEEEDIAAVDSTYRGVTEYVFEQIDQNEFREVYFRDDLWSWEDILHGTNENTKYLSVWVHEYCDNEGIDIEQLGKVRHYLTEFLFERHLDSYIEMTVALSIQSFVASIFIHPDAIYTLCHVIALGIYLFAISLLFINYKIQGDKCARIPLLLTGFTLGANVIITNLFFFGQQRYVVYTFGFFYISLYLLWKDTFESMRNNRKGKK